ncbi:hypothetical protein NMG60_11032229 [Bertholletia excelsa]
MIDLSYWEFKHGQLKGGDILSIKVSEQCTTFLEFEVKEIGVRILFQKQKEKSFQFKEKSFQFSCMGETNQENFEWKNPPVRLRQSFSATKALNIPLEVRYLLTTPSDYVIVSNLRHAKYLLESEVPRWCNFRSREPSIELIGSSYPNYIGVIGLKVCSIYTLLHHYQDIYYDDGQQYKTSINNKSTEKVWDNMYKWIIGDKEIAQDIMELNYWEIPSYKSMDKVRIEVLTNNKYFKVKEIGVQIIYKEYEESQLIDKVYLNGESYASIHDYTPHNYKFTLNTDVIKRDMGDYFLKDVVYGGVFRDGEGKWILGYYGHIGDGQRMVKDFDGMYEMYEIETILAEWVIYKGLTIILEKGWSNILIQSANWEVVQKLHNITTSHVCTPSEQYEYYYEPLASRSMVLKDILFLCSSCNCTLSYICPTRNKLAKLIAELGKGSDDELVVLENPPDDLEIKDILLAEMKMKYFT